MTSGDFKTEADGWVPEWEGQRPPFAPGNQMAVGSWGDLRHGAWSDRKVRPIAQVILQDMLSDPACEYLRAPRFAAELTAWSVAEARCRLLESYIARLAEGDDTGVGDLSDERTRSAWALLHRCETRAQSGRDRLGLSPLSAGRIGRDLALAQSARDLDRLKQIGGALLDADADDDNQEGETR